MKFCIFEKSVFEKFMFLIKNFSMNKNRRNVFDNVLEKKLSKKSHHQKYNESYIT